MLAPLFLISGAPGAGKTAVAGHVRAHAAGLVVAEMDDLLDGASIAGLETLIASPEAAAAWPGYNRLWARIVDVIRRSGVPMLLLGPMLPAEAEAAGMTAVGLTRWARLDCSAGIQARRLAARGWDGAAIAEAVADAETGRAVIATAFHTDASSPEATARAILAWVAGCSFSAGEERGWAGTSGPA